MTERIIGNSSTKEIHYSNCYCLKMARRDNLIPFSSIQEALQEGYNGCGHCMEEYDNYKWNIKNAPRVRTLSEKTIKDGNLTEGFSVTKQHEPWDLVIIGAGPTGLSAAKLALENHLSIIVLEKADKCASDRRAETVNSNVTIDRIWGDGFLEDITVDRHIKNMFYSPYSKKNRKVNIVEAPHSFHWRGEDGQPGLIDKMEEKLGITYSEEDQELDNIPEGWEKDEIHQLSKHSYLFTNVEVVNAGIADEWSESTPIRHVETSRGRVYGNTFLDCSGYYTRIGRQLQDYTPANTIIDHFDLFDRHRDVYDWIVNPIVKSNWHNNYPTEKYPDFQAFFVPQGAAKSVPDSPPGMIVIFPYEKGNAEINFQVFDEYSSKMPEKWEKQVEQVEKIWAYLKEYYPVFSDIMKCFKPSEDKIFEQVTGMPSAGMFAPPMIVPGLAIIGDAAGHMIPKTSSGLETGMKDAEFWVNVAVEMRHQTWTQNAKDKYNKTFINSEFYQNLFKKHRGIRIQKDLMFGLLKWGINESHDYPLDWMITVLGYCALEKKEAMEIELDEYKTYDWVQQAAIINAILDGVFVLNKAEETILDFLEATKKEHSENWDEFLTYVDMDKLFARFQGPQFHELFDVLGPLSAVEYAISHHSKRIIIKDVDTIGIRKASLGQRSKLVNILITSPPLGNQGENKLLDILRITVEDHGENAMKQIVSQAGGINQIYNRVQGKERKELRKIYPIYKSCLICGGDGKLFEPEVCPNCGGSGIKERKKCDVCDGDGEKNCWRCGGDGKILDLITPSTCWNCNGTGKGWLFRTCWICGGDGKINDNWPPPQTCPKCGGSGTLNCWRCSGSGEIVHKCLRCAGDGWIKDLIDECECWNCGGNGKVLV